METNVGRYDRIIRVGLGTGLLIVGVLAFAGLIGGTGSTTVLALKVVVTVVGALLAVTGLLQTCPVYSALGLDTR